MVSYRIVPFHPSGFDPGEGPGNRNVTDLATFRGWIEEKGSAFTQTAPGERGGVLIYAWSGSKPWFLVGEALVATSGPSGRDDQPHLVRTERPKLYPNAVPWLRGGGLFVEITQGDYEAIQKRAYGPKTR